jgi:hypothetical protein
MSAIHIKQTRQENGTVVTRRSSVAEDGTVRFVIHSDNGPAVMHPNGDCEWWEDGVKLKTKSKSATTWYENGSISRRNDLPAIVRDNGTQEWLVDGSYYRDGDKPTVITGFGMQRWTNRTGDNHREDDKPAVIADNGDAQWFKNGFLHREGDKPAVVCNSGNKEWWVNGKKIKAEIGGRKIWYEYSDSTPCVSRSDGEPAVIHANGDREWWVLGKRQEKPRVKPRVKSCIIS